MKDEAFRALCDEMQFYKLELVNREQNYNKVFGSNPSVGVFNPLTKKNGSTAGNGGMNNNGNNGNARAILNGSAMGNGLPPLGKTKNKLKIILRKKKKSEAANSIKIFLGFIIRERQQRK